MLSNIIHVLLGAALVAIGILASALADRLRGLRVSHRLPESAREAPRDRRATTSEPLRVMPVEVVRETPPAAKRAGRAWSPAEANEVVAALVAAGYKRAAATEAVTGCDASDRETIERWTAAALRRAARGAVS